MKIEDLIYRYEVEQAALRQKVWELEDRLEQKARRLNAICEYASRTAGQLAAEKMRAARLEAQRG